MSATTNVVPALREVLRHARRDMTIYIISDMEIHDALRSKSLFEKLSKCVPKVVLFLISPRRRFVEQICEVVKSAGISDVRGYWVNPLKASKIKDYVIKEINL